MTDKKLTKQEQKEIDESLTESENETDTQEDALATVDVGSEIDSLYGGNYANAGTEEVNQEDLNTPTLKLVQDNTKNLPDKKVGFFHRSDTGEQLSTVDVSLVSLTTKEQENYNKTGMEKVKIYFGFYAGTNEPFKMYLRGGSLGAHRQLQSEILAYKNRMKIPMFALTIRLTSVQKIGISKEGVSYDVRNPIFTVVKDERDASIPVIERDPLRIGFLLEAVERFKEQAKTVEVEEREPLPFS